MLQTNEHTQTYSYIPKRKWVEYGQIPGSNQMGTISHRRSTGDKVTEVTKTTIISTDPTFNITKVETWFSSQEIEYRKNISGPTTGTPQVDGPHSDAEPSRR